MKSIIRFCNAPFERRVKTNCLKMKYTNLWDMIYMFPVFRSKFFILFLCFQGSLVLKHPKLFLYWQISTLRQVLSRFGLQFDVWLSVTIKSGLRFSNFMVCSLNVLPLVRCLMKRHHKLKTVVFKFESFFCSSWKKWFLRNKFSFRNSQKQTEKLIRGLHISY